MDLLVRPAHPHDPCVPLLFESAKPYYTAYAGSEERALRLLQRVFTREGHAASYEFCQVATAGERIVGVVAGFPVKEGDRLSRRFVSMTLRRLPPWRLPRTLRHLHAAGGAAPPPPPARLFLPGRAPRRRALRAQGAPPPPAGGAGAGGRERRLPAP